MFSANTYRERREHLKKRMDKGLLLFLGNHESPMNYADNTYHFRQDSSFLYFWALDVAGLAAIIDLESGEETIFGKDLTVDDIVRMGPQLGGSPGARLAHHPAGGGCPPAIRVSGEPAGHHHPEGLWSGGRPGPSLAE